MTLSVAFSLVSDSGSSTISVAPSSSISVIGKVTSSTGKSVAAAEVESVVVSETAVVGDVVSVEVIDEVEGVAVVSNVIAASMHLPFL